MRYGRTRLFLAKIATVFYVCLACGAVFFDKSWNREYPLQLGRLSRPVQSLSGYLDCKLPITVRELLCFIFLYRLLAIFIFANSKLFQARRGSGEMLRFLSGM